MNARPDSMKPMKQPIPTTMRAVRLHGQGFESVRIERVPVPIPGPRQALVRVDAAGICASLIKVIGQGPGHPYVYGWDLSRFPMILGDEGSVTLVAAGGKLDASLKIGSRYSVQPSVDCAPVNDRERYRNQGDGIVRLGCGHTLPGFLSEYMLIPEEIFEAECMIPVPDSALPHAHAALAEPISCCISGQYHHMHLAQPHPLGQRLASSGIKPGGVVAIVGLGAMGRMHAEVALAQRPTVIIGSDPIRERRARAAENLAGRAATQGVRFHCVGPEQLSGVLRQESAGRGADDLIIAVGAVPVIEASLPLVARGGAVNLFAGLRKGESTAKFDVNLVHYEEVVLTGSSGGTPWDIQQALSWMSSGRIEASRHIAKIGDLEHVVELIHDVRLQRLDGKAIVYPHRRIRRPFEVRGWSGADEAAYLTAGGP